MNRKLLVAALFLLASWSSAWADPALASVQRKLKDQGFYYGEITGEKDADTTAAIRRYQIRNGLHITGEVDAETQRSLGLTSKPAGPPKPRPANTPLPDPPDSQGESRPPKSAIVPPRPPQDFHDAEDAPDDVSGPSDPRLENAGLFAGTPFAAAPPDVQRTIIISAQMILLRQGYYRAGIDGEYGPGMNFALRSYQARIGLTPSGRLDVETLASLDLLPRQRTRRFPAFHRRTFPPRTRIGPAGELIYIPR